MSRARILAIVAGALSIAAAGDPAERLADPRLEARAEAIFHDTRCPVCQGQSIDDSDAPLAHDLRRIIRDQVAAGRDEGQIRQFLFTRYGDFVLFRPRFTWLNALLWGTPILAFLTGMVMLLSRPRRAEPAAPLTDVEEDRIAGL